ncbi:MAG: transcriptional activator RfaH [Verrucomicrobia bacterium]|nr:transcriptional activator RfaH [Verrucomicrobiota bacterium]
MQTAEPAWYCARTKPKHEHIAAANVNRHLGLEVFLPRLRTERVTQRGIMRVVEPLFPCYVFVRCVLEDRLNEIRYTTGISSLVHFGDRIPAVPDAVVGRLRECFGSEEPMRMADDRLSHGASVVLADGAFAGMNALVLRALPARHRVQVLLEILGRAIPVEVDRSSIVLKKGCVADRMPLLALAHEEMLRA